MAIKKKIRVLEAKYVPKEGCIAIVGECDSGRIINQIHRSCFSFGGRSETQIEEEMRITAKMMIGKEIYLVFDEELDGKIKDNYPLIYR